MNPLRLLVLLVSLPLLLGGCGEKEVSLERRKGIVYLKGSDTPYTGKYAIFYDDENKEFEGNYKNGKEDGLFFAQ